MVRGKSSVFEASALKRMVSWLFSFLDSTTQGTDTLECWMTGIFESVHHLSGCRVPFSFRCVGVLEKVPYHFFSSPRPRSVQCPRENLFAYFLTFSEFAIQIPSFPFLVQSMSLNIDMKMIQSVNFLRFNVPFSQIILAREESAMTTIQGDYSTRIQLVLHRFPAVVCKKWT